MIFVFVKRDDGKAYDSITRHDQKKQPSETKLFKSSEIGWLVWVRALSLGNKFRKAEIN